MFANSIRPLPVDGLIPASLETDLEVPPSYSDICEKPPKVRMRDLSKKGANLKKEYRQVLERVLDHGILVKGEEIESVNNRLGQVSGKSFNHLLSCASSGLYLALQTLGVREGDEVITTPLSWLMTSSVIKMLGATPIYVDARDDYNMDLNGVEHAITSKTKAVLPVHYYGKVLDTSRLRSLCDEKGIYLVEDVAQAVGGSIGNEFAGSNAHISVLSFGPLKNISTLGDLGAVCTDSEEIFERIKVLSECGVVNNGEICLVPSLKHYPDALQAAFLSIALDQWKELLSKRIGMARYYTKHLIDLEFITTPMDLGEYSHTYFDYTISAQNRDQLLYHLFKWGIEAKVRHPFAINEQPAFKDSNRLPHSSECKNAKRLTRNSLCIPIHYNLRKKDLDCVIDSLLKFKANGV